MKIFDVRSQKGDAAFLLDDGKTSILYDTGFGFTGYAVAENVKAVLQGRELDYIFLTHSHYDHALGSAYVSRCYPGAKVVAGSYAASVFRREGALRTMKELDAAFARQCGVEEYEFLGNELKVDLAVEEGDVIRAGAMAFEVIALPGHTRCCVGYYCEKEGLLLSCETLGVYDGDKTIVPSFLVSFADTLASMEKIKHRAVRSILSPHYGLLSAAQTRYFLEHMETASREAAKLVADCIRREESEEAIVAQIKAKYWHGYIREIYPEDAVTLNSSILVRLIRKEFFA